jgi:hypothetical protein
MAKFLTFAVAGSGKTTRLVDSINPDKRSLVLTYTSANIENIRAKVLERFGCIPETVTISPYFAFIFSFCLRPFLADHLQIEGINYKHIEQNYIPHTSDAHYMNHGRRIWASRIIKAIIDYGFTEALVTRLDKYFDCIYIDEVQDLASRDFDFLQILGQTSLDIEIIGDFFQHTYDSSRDQNYRNGLFDDFVTYRKLICSFGYQDHPAQLTKSYRCSKSLCDYISHNLGIQIASHHNNVTDIRYIEDEATASSLLFDPNIVKLFYSQHFLYDCLSRNWGECKGEDDYGDVCVVLNKSSNEHYQKGTLSQSAPLTKNKLYVAMTRARGNVYLVSEEFVKRCALLNRNGREA